MILGNVTIDSCKWRLPLIEGIELKSDIFLEKKILRVGAAGGEVFSEELNPKREYQHRHGIKTQYQVKPLLGMEYLYIEFNSKLLEKDYFKGIHEGNLFGVYESIVQQNKVHLPFELFQRGLLTDIDFKRDLIMSNQDFLNALKYLDQNAKMSTMRDRGIMPYNNKENLGREFNKRGTKSYLTAPYIKVYHKTRELFTRSPEFTKKFLSPDNQVSKDLIRVEATIKGKKHLRAFDIGSNDLKTVVGLSEAKRGEFIKKAFSANLRTDRKEKVITKELSPKEIEELLLLRKVLKIQSADSFLRDIENAYKSDPKSKSRKLKKWGKIISLNQGLNKGKREPILDSDNLEKIGCI